MQKIKFFVTASAVCFALAAAAFSNRQSELSKSPPNYPGGRYNDACLPAVQTDPANCSFNGKGARCMVKVIDSWGNEVWLLGWSSPTPNNPCLLELKAVI